MRRLTLSVSFALAMTAAATAQNAGSTTLPGGSSSLQESFETWMVRCAAKDNGRACNIIQQQRHRETKQIILAVELTASASGNLTGNVALPFGLRLDDGVTTQIDDKPTSKPMRFSTCLPVGCLVPLTFDKAAVSLLRAGNSLKINATANNDGKKVTLSVSLKGFPAALARLTALGG